jgi:hypothetical protein
MEVSEFFVGAARPGRGPISPAGRGVLARLEGHVTEGLAGWPWKPFHHTLGLSGYEVGFNHPDELFLSLALALPFLTEATATKVRQLLVAELERSPPYGLDGWDNRAGRPRESYDVPGALRLAGRGRARSALGVYAFWLYCHQTGDGATASAHWPAIQNRMQPLVDGDYTFDPRKTTHANDEAEKLNGDLAGLLGLARLARLNGAPELERRARARGRELLELRVNLDRVNPQVLERTQSTTKHLHVLKLARYCGLAPEVGEALRRHTEGLAAARLRSLREERNGWHLAFGDRLIGGENYTNPLHLSRALFAGAALVERLPAGDLMGFLDVPWCKGDFYFIEKCALALRTDASTPGSPLP